MPTHILGISALYHDAAAALLRDGEIVAMAQEERFTRVKHDPSFPVRAVQWCLEEAGIRIGDVEHLVFYEKPLRKFDRILSTDMATFPRSWRAFPRHMRVWLGDKLWTRNNLSRVFSYPADRILFSEHHLSHAASAFLCSPFSEAAVLTLDGVGEAATTALWRGTSDPPALECISELRFPHSLGMLYSSLTAYLGFAVNNGEYKVMGMAPYGTPRFLGELERLVHLEEGGGFTMDMSYFSYHYHPTRSFSKKLETLLGTPRVPGSKLYLGPDAEDASPEDGKNSQRFADIAASTQKLLEKLVLRLVEQAHKDIGGPNLCLAGGVALNSVANHVIAREGPFESLWIQPAAGDAGGALGAALWAWHCVQGNPRRAGALERSDHGKAWSREEVAQTLTDIGAQFEDLGSVEAAADHAAQALADGKVVAWCEGRFEWGPRALGRRSILADPRREEMKDVVNARVKFREAFRPFAPSVLEESVGEYFDLAPAAQVSARFMLTACPVRPEKIAEIPATTHVDGSARVQVVRAQDNPIYHRLIRRFGELTGVPVVLNTSFNLKGEPIVASPIDAMATLLRCDLDALYYEGFRVEQTR
jgi:carbamoyltransferase